MNNINAQSIYIHIPFCKSKCPYCDFTSWANKENLIDKYFEALLYEIKTKCEVYGSYRNGEMAKWRSPCCHVTTLPIRSIFIGGGTPSLIPPEYYEKIFNELNKYFVISKDCEITLELNPGTASKNYLKDYKYLGINRISIGVQSFNEEILQTLGRKHTVAEAIDAINMVKDTGFVNFSFDLIFAVPGMTKETWISTIYKALKFNPKHISAYSLIIEPDTPFENIYKDSKLLLKDELTFDLYMELCKILKQNNFIHYEISNFARQDYESKHNLNYWLAKEYFAFGVSAHRYLNGLRTRNIKELNQYILSPNIETILDFQINYHFEKVMLMSRLNTGFTVDLLEKVSSKSTAEIKRVIMALLNSNLIELSRNKMHLTDEGFFVNNEILLKLM